MKVVLDRMENHGAEGIASDDWEIMSDVLGRCFEEGAEGILGDIRDRVVYKIMCAKEAYKSKCGDES